MSSQTAKWLLPYSQAADTVASVATTMQALANRSDLLNGESGQITISPAAGVSLGTAVVLSRSYPGNPAGIMPGMVHLQLVGTLAASVAWNWWINTWTGAAGAVTGFNIVVQFSAAQAGRTIQWRYMPSEL